MKRLSALCLTACLLTGCTAGPFQLTPPQPGAQSGQAAAPAATEPPARVLEVYDPQGTMEKALQVYGQDQGVTVTARETPQDASLAITPEQPDGETSVDMAAQGGLVQVMAGLAAGGGEHCYGLPLGEYPYGYLANAAVLRELLTPADTAVEALQKASGEEWTALITALTAWLAQPAETTVTLNGGEYILPAQKTPQLELLQGVFTVAGQDQFAGPVLAPVLGTCYKTAEEAAAGGRTQEELTGALNSLWSLLEQESSSMAGPDGPLKRGENTQMLTREQACNTYTTGAALFYRASCREVLGNDAQSVVIPLKFSFDETDLHGGYSLQELAGQPVMVQSGWITIPAGAENESGTREAEAFLLWLYASEKGRELLPKAFEGTGLPNLAAVLPAGFEAAANSQGLALLQKETWTKADRSAYTSALLEQLQ